MQNKALKASQPASQLVLQNVKEGNQLLGKNRHEKLPRKLCMCEGKVIYNINNNNK